MDKKLVVFILIGSIFLAGCQLRAGQNTDLQTTVEGSTSTMPMIKSYQDRDRVVLKLDTHQFEVELVTTQQSTAQGLSGRDSIGADGMLFIFPNSQRRQFWMKDMLFPIDIIWIKDLKVVGLTENVPIPVLGTVDDQLTLYPSPSSVDMVLELPAGTAARNKIAVGAQISLE